MYKVYYKYRALTLFPFQICNKVYTLRNIVLAILNLVTVLVSLGC